MTTPLIKAVVSDQLNKRTLVEHATSVATDINVPLSRLMEAATHVLANLADKVSREGVPMAMSPASMAAFMAGIDYLTNAIPNNSNNSNMPRIRKLLNDVRIGPDGYVTTDAATIAQLGARSPETLNQYRELIKSYLSSLEAGKPNSAELLRSIKALKYKIGLIISGVEATV